MKMFTTAAALEELGPGTCEKIKSWKINNNQ
jgi:hypothetical protein